MSLLFRRIFSGGLMLTVALLGALPSLAVAQGFDPEARAMTIAPYLDSQTIAVLHLDLQRIDAQAGMDFMAEKFPAMKAGNEARFAKTREQATSFLEDLRKAGGREVFVVLSMADIPMRPPLLAMKIAPGGDAEKAARMMQLGPQRYQDPDAPLGGNMAHRKIGDLMCLSDPATLERIEALKPVEIPNLAAAFRVAGDTAAQAVFVPSADARRVVREGIGELPEEIGNYSGADLADGVQFAALGIDFPPKINVRLGVQSKDEASATKLRELATSALQMASDIPAVKELFPKFEQLHTLLTPKQQGDRLILMLNEQNGGVEQVVALLTPPVEAARAAAQRAQSMNNLKQLALAVHIYHDTHKAFPPAHTAKDGKPLLSWRVHLLPYLEEQDLYDQFKLDEPWDSEHNKKLIVKMPKVFTNPSLSLDPGMTAYLAPTGKEMAFHADRKTAIFDITDGTSNTIMIVEANADRAVTWTAPDDLPIDLEKPLSGLGTTFEGGFLAAFCDGSVRFISEKVDPKTLSLLFQMADGKPINIP